MSNKSFDDMVNDIKKQNNNGDAQDYLMKQLNPAQTKKLQALMSNPNALEQLLSTPQAKNLLKKFTEDKNG